MRTTFLPCFCIALWDQKREIDKTETLSLSDEKCIAVKKKNQV